MRDTIAQRLREVRVRPTVGARERQRWDELMAAHHYLPFRTLVGRSLRHVAVLGERWLALIGWHAGAFKLRPRDEWIGWLPEQQFRRLHLLANNTRFVIVPEAQGVMNLASRVLGQSTRRLGDDMRKVHGHPSTARRNVRRSGALHGRVLPRGELATAGAPPRGSPATPGCP